MDSVVTTTDVLPLPYNHHCHHALIKLVASALFCCAFLFYCTPSPYPSLVRFTLLSLPWSTRTITLTLMHTQLQMRHPPGGSGSSGFGLADAVVESQLEDLEPMGCVSTMPQSLL
jgi:hypothetical protein